MSRYLIRLPALLILFTVSFHQSTSAAAPFATGLAALILAQTPTLTPDQVMNQIKASAQDVNQSTFPGDDDFLGSGRINAQNALTLGAPAPDETKALVTIDYTYDKNGNQIQKSIQIAKAPSSIFTHTYDFENRLTAITSLRGGPGGADEAISSFTYDGLGKRIQSLEGGQTTRFLYDGLNAILEKNATGTTQASYTRGLSYGGGIGGIISATSGLVSSHYHYDGSGTVVQLTASTAKTIQTYTHDAFGNRLSSTGDSDNPYQFSTKEYNLASGLLYFESRYYDPRIGRFLTTDPFGMVLPDGSNLYSFVFNNPVNLVDSEGTTAIPINQGLYNPVLPPWYPNQPDNLH